MIVQCFLLSAAVSAQKCNAAVGIPSPVRDVTPCSSGIPDHITGDTSNGTMPSASGLCDPHGILSIGARRATREILRMLPKRAFVSSCGHDGGARPVELGIAIIRQLPPTPPDCSGMSTKDMVQNVARVTHKSWGIGHPECCRCW